MLGAHLDWRWYNIFDIDGVTIFFVLSGFLIGGILLKLANHTDFSLKDLRGFWVRRWFRTLPNYYIVLLFIIALQLVDPQPRSAFPPSGNLWQYFFFLQNFHYPHPDFFPEAWSLCVEECFYFIIPLLFYLSFRILRNNRKQVFLFWIIMIILWTTALRIYRISHYQIHDVLIWDYNVRKEVITRLDSIMCGCFGAYMLFYHKDIFYRFRKSLLVIGIILLMAPNIVFGFFLPQWGAQFKINLSIILGSLGTLALLPILSGLKRGPGLLQRSATFIALISYSMYLLNLSLIIFHIMPPLSHLLKIDDGKLWMALTQYAIYWLLTITLSWVLYRFYEVRMTMLREKFSRHE